MPSHRFENWGLRLLLANTWWSEWEGLSHSKARSRKGKSHMFKSFTERGKPSLSVSIDQKQWAGDSALAGISDSQPNPLTHNAWTRLRLGQTGQTLQDVRVPGGCRRCWAFPHCQAGCFALQVIKQGSGAAGLSWPCSLGSADQLPQALPGAWVEGPPFTLQHFLSPPLPKSDPETIPAAYTKIPPMHECELTGEDLSWHPQTSPSTGEREITLIAEL